MNTKLGNIGLAAVHTDERGKCPIKSLSLFTHSIQYRETCGDILTQERERERDRVKSRSKKVYTSLIARDRKGFSLSIEKSTIFLN